MKWIDYRENLAIGFNDDRKFYLYALYAFHIAHMLMNRSYKN